MSPERAQYKSCNEVQFRQSSTARAASGEAGTTTAALAGNCTANDPRVKAIASSRLSRAASSAETRNAVGTNRAGSVRLVEVVHTNRVVAATGLLADIVTWRDAIVQCNVTRATPAVSTNRAGSVRLVDVVHTNRLVAAMGLLAERVSWRDAIVQCNVTRATPAVSTKRASLPPVTGK